MGMGELTKCCFIPMFLFKGCGFFFFPAVSSTKWSGLVAQQPRKMLMEYWERNTVGRGSPEPLGPDGSKQLGFLNP